MRSASFAAALVALAGMGAPAAAQDFHLVKFTNPADMETYGPGATCVVTGFLQFPAAANGKESLSLRIRLYRAGKNDFIIEKTIMLDLKNPPKGKNRFSFQDSTLVMPKELGPYVLRVDCLDGDGPPNPKNHVATHSVFLKVQRSQPLEKPKKKAANSAAREVFFTGFSKPAVSNNEPAASFKFGTGANIPMIGTCDNDAVVRHLIAQNR